MKILAIHADFIEFQAKKQAFKGAEENISTEQEKVEECLVIFTAVEKRDEKNIEAVMKRYLQEIKNIAQQVNPQHIVLYPYAHLSSDLASPKIAEQFLKDAQQELQQKFSVYRAPFGWYKSFTIACKGHPLSELSREFSGEEQATSLKRDYKDEPFTFNTEALTDDQKVKLTAAYLTGIAVTQLYENAEMGAVGFYHDQAYVDVSNVKLRQDDLNRITKKVKELRKDTTFQPEGNPTGLQQQIAHDLKEPTFYTAANTTVTPLFPKPFTTTPINAIKLLSISSAYWKNNEKNTQLTRINLVAFDSQEKLQEYKKEQEAAANRSHLKIGKEQGLFLVSDLVGAGLPLIAPKGMIIKDAITDFLWSLHQDKGYQKVSIPHIAKDSLYKKSGHWDKFGEELFHVKGAHENFVMKPMNCPHHIQIFDNFNYSYRDLPIRFFEPTTVYRDEKAGQLTGLSRVRSITQDDGHIFCRIDQIKQEVKTIVNIILQFYKTLGMDKDYWVSLSVRGEDKSKYLGEEKVWNIAESSLEEAAQENNLPFKKILGEAAFYGPKLDFMFKDALGREWQLATVQLDFNLPERFELHYMNKEGVKERPVMIHRAISGSLERFMSVLIEHFAGKFPTWLSPVQVKVLTITDRNKDAAEKLVTEMKLVGIRVELDDRVESMGKKVRDAQMEHVNYIVTIGDKEQENNTVAVRLRNGETKFDMPTKDFIADVVKEIEGRSIN